MVNSQSGCFPKHPYLCSLRKSPVAFINIGKCRTPRTFPCLRSFLIFSIFSKKNTPMGCYTTTKEYKREFKVSKDNPLQKREKK
ncbi:hypothetical protein DUW73_13880 [Listeria monocytogenes]|nr:hypothetical protein [Listeria monocytogenes]